MADSICRALRDGALEGEHAPALTIKDSIASPYGLDVFTYILTQLSINILAGKSQSRALVLIAYSRSPSFYVDLLKRRGIDIASSHKWIQILDCYTDPLGWKNWLVKDGNANLSHEAATTVCTDVRNLDKLFHSIIEIGSIQQGKCRFSVAIDSVNEMSRHTSMPQVARLLSNLRSHDKISSTIWLLHSDLNEIKASIVLEYMSSIVATLQPFNQSANGQRGDLGNLCLLEQNSRKGKFHARFKRRNGRVRVTCEEFHVEQSGVNFISTSSEEGTINQSLVPKVQFNLQLSEEERIERSKVVLPFEHQGTGKPVQIYDGRRSLTDSNNDTVSEAMIHTNANSGNGEIIYFRDSDDERPDSDEDPDDDLDI